MAIVSNKNYKAVESLKNIYFEGLIDVALGENEAAGIKKKPAKDMVMSALDKLGSTQEKSIYVGDSEVDSQTAVNSGLDCILVSWGFRTKDILENTDRPIEHIPMVFNIKLKYLQQIFKRYTGMSMREYRSKYHYR